MTKTTTKNYVSVNIEGRGKDDTNYDIGEVIHQLDSSNFHGTEDEWQILLSTAEVKIENLGQM